MYVWYWLENSINIVHMSNVRGIQCYVHTEAQAQCGNNDSILHNTYMNMDFLHCLCILGYSQAWPHALSYVVVDIIII